MVKQKRELGSFALLQGFLNDLSKLLIALKYFNFSVNFTS